MQIRLTGSGGMASTPEPHNSISDISLSLPGLPHTRPRQLTPLEDMNFVGSAKDGAIVFPQADAIWRGVLISRKMAFVGEGLSTETLAVVPSAVCPEPKLQFLLTGLFFFFFF